MGLFHDQIDHRCAVAVDGECLKFVGYVPVTQIHCALGVIPGCANEIQRRRPVCPGGTAQALHAPAFLIDGNGGLAANGLAQFAAQAIDLIGRVDVAGKKDEPERVRLAKERRFIPGQAQPVRVEDRGTKCHRVTTGIQSAPSATSAEQKRRASLRSLNPRARRR